MYWLVNADAPAVTGPMDKGDTWFFVPTLPEGKKLEGESAKRLIRQATGRRAAGRASQQRRVDRAAG